MRTVLLASLRHHTRRYLAAVLAVVIGVAFIVVTHALSSSARAGMTAGAAVPYADADLVITGVSGERADDLLDLAAGRGARAVVLGWTQQPVAIDGEPAGVPVDIGVVAGRQTHRWQSLAAGRFPHGAGEAVADVNRAKSNGVAIGDRVTVGTGPDALPVTVVGLVDSPAMLVSAPLYLTWPDLSRWAGDMYVDSVVWASPDGDVAAAADLLRRRTDARVQPVAEAVAERQATLTNGVDVLALMLLVFAGIALFVAVMVIANTFSILFAQRARDFALLRCVGAARRQLLRTVRAEALLLGLGATVVGLVVGIGAGLGLVALVDAVADDAPMGPVSWSPTWLLGALAVGVLVTVVASWLPTRQVARQSPLAALRPEARGPTVPGIGRVRAVLGTLALPAGAALLALAMRTDGAPILLAGGAVCFAGVVLLGPVLVPALVRAATRFAPGRAASPLRLAGANAVRNPRRTAATAGSLLVGVTLTTAVLTGMASSREAVVTAQDRDHPLDVTLTRTGAPLPTGLLAQVRRHPGVADAVALTGVRARVSGGIGDLGVATAADAGEVLHDDEVLDVAAGEVLLPGSAIPEGAVPETVTLLVGERRVELRARYGDSWGGLALVAPQVVDRLRGPSPDTPATTRAVWVRAADGADAEDLTGDLAALVDDTGAEVASALSQRGWVTQQLDIMVGTVVGLLGIAVLIALVGIGNTLGLSVLERGREHALLRALGLTRGGLRRVLAAEAVLLTLAAAALGTTLGVAFAWAGVHTLVAPALPGVSLVLPVGRLAAVLAVAGLAGLGAAVLPARRAARVPPAAGLAVE